MFYIFILVVCSFLIFSLVSFFIKLMYLFLNKKEILSDEDLKEKQKILNFIKKLRS